jgi:hypothetical protein
LPAVASRLQDKPSAVESGGAGAAAPICDSKILKVGYKAAAIRESASARRLADRQLTAPQAQPQLLLNVGVHTNEHRLFDSAEQSTGRAPADDAEGQAFENNHAINQAAFLAPQARSFPSR